MMFEMGMGCMKRFIAFMSTIFGILHFNGTSVSFFRQIP